MAELTVANYLGMLLEDPYDARLVDELRELLGSEPANGNADESGQSPLRLLEAARGGHERRGEFLAAASLMEIESELITDDPEFRQVLLKELARIRRDELMDDRGALEAYERLGGLESDDPEVAQAVEQIVQAKDKWREIAHRFVEEARQAADPRLKTSLLSRAASLVWQYGAEEDHQQADAIFDEALAADPSHLRTARQYALSLRSRERWEDVVSVFVMAAKAARTREEKAAAWLQAARVLRQCLEDTEGAADAYRKVLELTPTDEEALGALVQYFTDHEAWDDLAAMYEGALRSRQNLEAEKGMLLQLAMVHWRFRDDPDAAEPYFARLRKIDAAHPGMLDFYRQRIGDDDPDGRLLTILGDALRTVQDSDVQLRLAREIGARANAADRPERALEAWKIVDRLAPGDLDARTALQQLYERGGKWNALSESIRSEIDALPADEKERKLRLLRDLIPIYRDALSLDSMLIQVYAEILTLSPHDAEALDALAELYEASGRWNELTQVLERKAEIAATADEKVALYLEVARLWIDRFGNLGQATVPLERVIALQPGHGDALSQLKEIYTKKRKWAALYNLIGKEAELADSPEQALRKKVEMAELATERLHHNAVAIRLWKEVWEQAPETPGALDALEQLAEREKDWDTLAMALRGRIGASSPPDRLEHLQRLGVVLMERLDRADEAVDVWEELLSHDPTSSRVRRTLRDAYVKAGAWDELHTLFSRNDDFVGLADVLNQAAEQSDDPEEVVELSLRAAAVYRDDLGEPQRAQRSLERALTVDEHHVEAATRLAPIYQHDQKWPRYAQMLEVIETYAGPSSDRSERLARIDALRVVTLDKLRDPRASFEWASRAYLLSPDEARVVAGLEQSAEAAGAYEELVTLFRARLDHSNISDDERVDLQRRIASIAGERLGQSEESIYQLEAILEHQPDDAEAMAVLDRLYRAERRFADLRTLYERRLKLATDPKERWVLLNEVAQVEEEQLGDLPAAAGRHWEILESNAHDVDALRAVERLSQQLKQWDRLDAALAKRLESPMSDEDRLAVFLQLADLRRIHLEDPTGALECYRDALGLDARNPVAIAGLESISNEGNALFVRAAALLEPAYAKRGDFDELAALLQKRLDRSDDADERQRLRLRLAELSATELGDAAGAYTAIESAFLNDPGDLELLERLGGVAEASGEHEAFAKALVQAIERGDAGAEAEVAMCRRAAELYDGPLGLPEEAARFHRRVIEDSPADATAFGALKQLHTKHERWDELRALYQRRIEATIDAGAKLDLLLQLCFLFEEILDAPREAIASYEQALELDPTHTPSRRALQRLYGRLKRWPELAELLQRDLDEATGQEAVDLAYELATLYETRLDRTGDAVDHYEIVLQSSPTHLRAQEALERLMEEPTERQRVAAILEPIFDSQGAWGELAKVLEVQLEDLSDAGARAVHLGRIGELAESKLQDQSMAFDAYARAVREDVADGSARADLARLAEQLGKHEERASLLEAGLERVSDAYVSTELCLELAELWERAGSDPTQTERAYARLLEQEPDNPDLVLKASRALERLHREEAASEALADDLRRQLCFEDDGEHRKTLLAELATLFEGPLEDRAAAIEAHRGRLELDPGDRSVLSSLRALYEAERQWSAFIDTLERQVDLSDDPSDQRGLLLRIATTYEQELSSFDDAIATYREILSRFGPSHDVVEALSRLYRLEERWHELLEVTELRADTAESVEDQIAHRFDAAELMRSRTGETERAFEVYLALLEQSPGHEPSVQALESLVGEDHGPVRLAAAHRLLEHYRSVRQYADQIRMLEAIATGDDPAERVDALLQAAETSEVGLEDADAAFEMLARALRAGVASEDLPRVLSDFERLALSTERFADCVATLSEVAPELLELELRIELRMRAAAMARDRLGDGALAREQYRKVLEQQPDHAAALDELLSLAERAGDHRELVDLLRRKAELCDQRDQRSELLIRQAQLFETQVQDFDAAIDAYDRALGENDHPDAYRGLERLYREAARWDDLATLYEREIDQRVGEPATVRYELGLLCLRRLNEPFRALDQFREALALDPDHEPTVLVLEELVERPDYRTAAAELLEPIYLRRMQWAKVTGIIEARLDGEQDPTQRLELLRHLGDVQESHLEDLEGALETYGRLFSEDPHDERSQEKLTRLARSLGRWSRLAEIFHATLQRVEVDDGTTADLALTTARLYDERLEQLEEAASYYRRALAYDPSHREAGTALAEVLAKSGRWRDLLELDRERESFAEDDDDRIAILHEIARVEVEELKAAADGVVTFGRILEIAPTDRLATTRLDELLERLGRWDDLARHIEFQVDNSEDAKTSIALRQRLGEITESKLKDVSRALDLYEDVLADEPTHQPALDAVTRLLSNEEWGPRAVQILEPIHRDADRWEALIPVLTAKAEQAMDALESAETWREVARLQEDRAGHGEQAFQAWARALRADPADEPTRAAVDRLAETLGAWPELVEACAAAEAAADDPSLKASFLRSIAEAQDRRLGDPRAAIATYGRILELDPDEAPALDDLEALQLMVGDWRGVARVYELKLDRASDGPSRAELFNRLGTLFEEQLGNHDRAVAYYQQATGEDPEDPTAYEALDRLFTAANDSERLADVLEQRLALEPEPEARVEIGLRLAELYEAQLARPDAAIEALDAVLDADREHRGALQGLSRLYERQGRWQELVGVLQRRTDAALHEVERVELTYQIGNIMERELDDELSAIAVYGQILRIDDQHEPSVQALLRITKLADYREDAAVVVEPHIRAQERWNDLASLLRLRADAMTDPHQKAEQLVALADVHEQGRQDHNAALDALLQSIGERPQDEAIVERAEEVARSLRRWPELVNVLYGEANASLEPERAASLFRRVARICEEELGDHAKAIDANERALSVLGDAPEILEDLDRLFEKTEQWEKLHDVVSRRLDALDADRPSLLLRQGRLRASRLGDLEGALTAYQTVMQDEPGREDAIAAVWKLADKPQVAANALDLLEEYYRSEDDLEEVVRMVERRVAMASSDAERVQLLTEAAGIWEHDLQKPEQAIAALRRAVNTDPRDRDLLHRLEELADRSGRWDDLRGLVEGIAASSDLDRRDLYELRLRSAEWYRERLHDSEAAERTLVEALDLDPEPLEAHAERVALLRAQGRSEALVAALRASAEAQPAAEDRAAQLLDAAEVAAGTLDDLELAAECYQSLLERERGHAQALSALNDIRRSQGRWNEVVALLERRLEVAADDLERSELAREIGAVYRGQLGDARAAIEAFEAALDFDDASAETMDALESLYEETDRVEALRSLLQRRCELVSEEERIALQLRLARLYERAFRDRTAAIAMLREILRADSAHAEALADLERLFEAGGAWDELVGLLVERAETAEGADKLALLTRIGTLHDEKRQDRGAAIEVYERVQSELGPDEASLRALVGLYEREARWPEMGAALEGLSDLVDEPTAVELAHRAADLWAERVGDVERAGAVLRKVHERFPDDAATRERLKDLYESQGDFTALARLLDDELSRTSADPDRVALLRQISSLYQERLDDPKMAAKYLEQAVALDGEDRGALVPLCDLYIAAGRQQDAVPILRRIIESYGRQRSKELAIHHHRLGQALESAGDATGALEAYDAAFKIDLTNVAILRDLGKLTHAQGDLDRAQKSFRALLLQKLEPASGIQKADVYFFLGDIAARQDDPRKAITMLERALAEDPSHDQASELLSQLKG